MTKTMDAVCEEVSYPERRDSRIDIYAELNEILPDIAGLDSGTVSETINEYLRGMRKSERKIFLARYCCGMEYDEAAAACGISAAAVREELAKMRRGLRKHIERSVAVYERE